MTQNANPIEKAITSSVLAFLPRIRPEQPQNPAIELRAALNDLNRCGLPKDMQLDRIDELVRRIAIAKCKRAILTGWEYYLFVDRRYKPLKLVRRIGGILTRCVRELQDTNHQRITRTDFYKIWRLSKSRSADASLAEEFLGILTQLRRKQISPKCIDWRRFHSILSKAGTAYIELKTSRCLPPDQSDTACYARCLEILEELPHGLGPPETIRPVLSWLRTTRARELPSKDNDLAATLLEYELFGRDVVSWRTIRDANRLTRKREKARNRQKRRRAKKVSSRLKKSDT